jgi:hypothetical protein
LFLSAPIFRKEVNNANINTTENKTLRKNKTKQTKKFPSKSLRLFFSVTICRCCVTVRVWVRVRVRVVVSVRVRVRVRVWGMG